MVTKKELADALRDVIDSFESLWKSEFKTHRGIPPYNKRVLKAKEIWNKYTLHKS